MNCVLVDTYVGAAASATVGVGANALIADQ
jgi:hypothetical protein